MIIHTLGTGSCEASAMRAYASTLAETSAGLIILDAGIPPELFIEKCGCMREELRAVFISHMHADHVAGLATLVRSICMLGCKRKVDIYLPEESAEHALKSWLSAMHVSYSIDNFCRFHTVREGIIFREDEVRVRAVATEHMKKANADSYAYEICDGGTRMLYSGDLSADLHDLPKQIFEEEMDLFLMEATHYTPAEAAALLRQAKIKQLVLTHIHTPWQSETGEAELRKAFLDLPFPVCISRDGMRIKL